MKKLGVYLMRRIEGRSGTKTLPWGWLNKKPLKAITKTERPERLIYFKGGNYILD